MVCSFNIGTFPPLSLSLSLSVFGRYLTRNEDMKWICGVHMKGKLDNLLFFFCICMYDRLVEEVADTRGDLDGVVRIHGAVLGMCGI